MNSSNDSRKISVSSCAFPGSIDLAESLLPILAKYQAEDVFSSVFCILSWHQNRSIQECAAALNAALVSISKFGKTPIDTYKCFEAFYSDIKQLCPISEYEDYVLPVMGHTKIDFNGKWWNALYGCGMTQEYPRLCFANDVCKAANRLAEFESLLRYVDTMSENLHRGGWNADAAETIGMHLPPEKHWVCVRRWFATNPAKELCNGVVENLSDRAAFIEKMHFVRNGGQTTPLFNPSVLCDYFESCCSLIDPEEYTGIIDIALAKQAEMSFGLEGPNGECCIAYPCFKVGEGLLENCPATLLLFDGRDTVSIFYNHCQGDGNLESMRDLFATRHGRIDVIEGIKRGKGRRVLALSDSSALKLALIAYADNTIPVLEYTFVDKSRIADETCGSIDLISMLQASSSIEELNAYFLYLKSTSHRIMTMFAGLSDNFICWKESDRTIIQGAEDVGNPISIWCDFNETDRYYCELFSGVLVDYPIVNGSYLLGSPFSHCFTRDDRGFLNVKRKTGNVHVGVSKRLKGELDSYFFMRADHLAVAGLSIDQLEKEEHVYSLIKDALECLINSLEGEIGRFASLQGGLICIEYVAEECDDADSFKQVNERLGLKGVFVNGDYPVVRFSVSKSAFLRALMESDNRSIECDLGVGVLSLMLSDHDSSWEELLSAFERIRRNKKMVDTMEFAIPYVWQHRGFQVEETNVSRSKALKLVACAAKKAGAHPGEYYGTAANAILRSFQSDLIGYLKIELGKYEQKSLIVGLYEVMAEASHEFFLHTARFGSFGKLDDGEKKRLHDSTLDRREDARRRVRAAQYCIETVMSFGLGGSDIPGNQELSFIISLANQVLSSCDDADILLFEPKGFGIRISDDYTVSAIENEDATVNSRLLKMRQLLDPGHIGNETTDDLRYINKAKAAYKRDTGVSFECFLSVLDLLALGIDETDLGCHRVCNVVIVDRNHLNSFITAKLEDDFDSSELLSCVSR